MINWFPGHMAKAKNQLEKNLKMIDLVIEILDARIPETSSNPFLIKMLNGKPVLKVFNKSDLVNNNNFKKWETYFKENNINYLKLNAKQSSVKNQLINKIKEVLKDKIEKDLKRNIKNPQFHVCVIGIPNVGKSTFINNILNKSSAKTGNKPGLTKGQQWIKINEFFYLLDTPGILYPKINDEAAVVKLIICNNIKVDIIPKPEYVYKIIGWLYENNFNFLIFKYNLQESEIAKLKLNNDDIEEFYVHLTLLILEKKYKNLELITAYQKIIYDMQNDSNHILNFELPISN
ncbi:ribosome biogenesis GTPase YlqF [Spiroplasma endosymbiont of Amphibalanus improvisus]|uniref:ribosome biogenesis GTPase YlqF n=1 Tax=Spiroplasma endosymbiont of Amphibalanus improvisus TaxID=3066327 RepID=UPI00313EAABC